MIEIAGNHVIERAVLVKLEGIAELDPPTLNRLHSLFWPPFPSAAISLPRLPEDERDPHGQGWTVSGAWPSNQIEALPTWWQP